jgi:hypothetical protein
MEASDIHSKKIPLGQGLINKERFARSNGAQLQEKRLVEVQVSDHYSERIKLYYSNGFSDHG